MDMEIVKGVTLAGGAAASMKPQVSTIADSSTRAAMVGMAQLMSLKPESNQRSESEAQSL